MKNILVIEDNPKHLQDAKNFFSTIEGIEVTYRESYKPFDAMSRSKKSELSDDFRNYDGIISDIYFPGKPGEKVQPMGVSVMFQANFLNIPCVLCTDGYHHGNDYEWIHEMCMTLRFEMKVEGLSDIVDSGYGSDRLPEEGEHGERVAAKGWSKAWEDLQKQL